jgi:hypothetical protein
MSKQEFGRLDVLLRVQSGRLRVSDACVLIGLQRRQVFRLLRGLKKDGATSLLSKRRGRPSNHRLPAEVRTLAVSIDRLWQDRRRDLPSPHQARRRRDCLGELVQIDGSAGCSPAEPASASPVTDNGSAIPIRRGADRVEGLAQPTRCLLLFGEV